MKQQLAPHVLAVVHTVNATSSTVFALGTLDFRLEVRLEDLDGNGLAFVKMRDSFLTDLVWHSLGNLRL
jgi:hypothetical protein